MKKLGIVTGSMSRGGAERVSLALAQYFSSKGIEVVLLTSTVASVEYEVPSSIKRIALDQEVKSSNKIMRLPQLISIMRRTIKENKIDTVLIMGVPLCLFAIPGCKGTGAKVVVSERNDPTHFEGKKIVQIISRHLMKRADGYVFQTKDAQAYYTGLSGTVIPNPLLGDNLCEPYDGIREKTIVTAGRMIPQKNQRLLLETFYEIEDKFAEYKLVLYGDGALRKEFEEFIQTHNLQERVEMPGNVADLPEKIKGAGVFVLPSNFEGMPNALIEAMALGIPCISTDCPCGGPRDLIREGENGLLVSVGNKEELKSAIIKLLTDEEMAFRLGKTGSAIRKDLSMPNIGERWMNYLEGIS